MLCCGVVCQIKMYDEHSDSTIADPLAARCSMTTFLNRIAFTVFHASLYIERVCLVWATQLNQIVIMLFSY